MDLNCFTNILENFDHLKGSGILTDERITEIKQYLSDENFVPVKLEDGRVIKDWTCHKPSGTIWANTIKREDGWGHYVYQSVLSHFLTEEEIERINRDASSFYSAERERKRFEKAEKIPAAEWNGPVYWNDNYYSDVDDFLDQMADEEFFEDVKYVWACDDVRPACQLDLDSIIESATEDAYEDFETDDLTGLEDLEKAIETFNKLNEKPETWYSNEKIAIIL